MGRQGSLDIPRASGEERIAHKNKKSISNARGMPSSYGERRIGGVGGKSPSARRRDRKALGKEEEDE